MSLTLIPESHIDLLQDEVRAYAYLATVMGDGTPQVTPVWFNTNEDFILINSAKGRVKDRNMRQRSSIAVVIQDPNNPFRYMQVRGRIVEITEKGARQHINTLSEKYTGNAEYTLNDPNEVRVIYMLRPEKAQVMG
ncbi:MAG: PPOX class F420-dependent oxidoreductase [Anaerolineales bacterium]